MKKCPRCGYERTDKDDGFISKEECPRCGIYYTKYVEIVKSSNGEDTFGAIRKDTHEDEQRGEAQISLDNKTKKCPFCAEVIQSEAIKCKHCGEWLEKKEDLAPAEQASPQQVKAPTYSTDKPVIMINKDNWFGNVKFVHKGNTYRVGDITALVTLSFTYTLNFVPSHTSGFYVTLANGTNLRYWGQSVVLKTEKINNLNTAFNFLSKITFSQRVNQYLRQIKDQGFFQYHDYFIYDNGDIKYKNDTINIAEAALQNYVQFGSEVSFLFNSYYTPNDINIWQDNPGGIFKKHKNICIHIAENRDVIYAILMKLAELKGGKIRIVKS